MNFDTENSEKTLSDSHTCSDYCEQIRLDLESFISNFPNKSFAIRVLAKESAISEKTIKRLLKKTNRPTYDTIFALYAVILETEDEELILSKVAPSLSNYLNQMTARKLKKKKNLDYDFLEMLKKDPVICELFVQAATGGVNESAIGYRYGQYGLELLERMSELKILRAVDKGVYELSPHAPSVEGEVLKFIGLRFSEVFSKPTNSQETNNNVMSFYANSLNEEGYKEWLRIDTEAFYKKLEVAKMKEYKGAMRYFTFNATDSMSK